MEDYEIKTCSSIG